jgi:hypothetical protein
VHCLDVIFKRGICWPYLLRWVILSLD